ncbi:hypothetical protein AUP07_0689 [methanogenic archaeon mixed culture ISO4-G1]|nr:hypothetical protein AUP07_0689 [methanogenic archaeon mixed culture ISO4-G1]
MSEFYIVPNEKLARMELELNCKSCIMNPSELTSGKKERVLISCLTFGVPVVTFYTDDGRKIKCDRYRCSQCGKVLRVNSWTHTCWKCGGYMDTLPTICWD